MALFKADFINAATTTLNGAINSIVTSLTVTDGTIYPNIGGFYILIDQEIMLVTDRSTHVLTVTRAQAGTTGASHSDSATVATIITKDNLNAWMQQHACTLKLSHGFQHWTARHQLYDDADLQLDASSFSAGGTANDVGDGTIFLSDAPAGTTTTTGAYRTDPTGSYTVTARIQCDTASATGPNPDIVGFLLRDSSNANIVFIYQRTGRDLVFAEWDSLTDTVPSTTIERFRCPSRSDHWVRLVNDTVDIEGFVSSDGINWRSMGTESVGASMTPTQVGFNHGVGSDNGHDAFLISYYEE